MANGALTKKDIVGSIRQAGGELRSLGVRAIGLFGSFARGDASERSDVDILLEFDSGKDTYDNFIGACFLLDELLGQRVEVVTGASLSPYIKPYIMKEVEYVPLPA